jgi:hypothetical protein
LPIDPRIRKQQRAAMLGGEYFFAPGPAFLASL